MILFYLKIYKIEILCYKNAHNDWDGNYNKQTNPRFVLLTKC